MLFVFACMLNSLYASFCQIMCYHGFWLLVWCSDPVKVNALCQLFVEHMFAKTMSQVDEMRVQQCANFLWSTCLQKHCHK